MAKPTLIVISILAVFSSGAMGATFFHAADTAKNWAIDLSELLRVIQFYNSDGYHLASGTEDGFAPGGGDVSGRPHSSDYAPQDWRIELPELLRTIQFFNVRGFVYKPGAEDQYEVNPWHVPVPGDLDGDGLTDEEELTLGMDPYDADEDGDGKPDGRALARLCAETWLGLPGCSLGVCGLPSPNDVGGEESLLDVTECRLCMCMTEESACYWEHPETHVQVNEFWWITYDLCHLRDGYIASGGDIYEVCTSTVSARWMESAAMPFLSSGSFSYYDLSCSFPGDEWVWDPAAIRRLDVVYYIKLLLLGEEISPRVPPK